MTQKEVINILAEPEITHCIYEISELHMYTKHYLLIAEELCEDGILLLPAFFCCPSRRLCWGSYQY